MPVKGKHLLHYVPHGIDSKVFNTLPKNNGLVNKLKKELLGDTNYKFVIGFNSRNTHRKHPANLILAFKNFCDHLTPEQAKECALLMHTDKTCDQGTNLLSVIEAVCPDYTVVIDENRRTPEEMVAFYNICDVVANVSSNEGFGLSIAGGLQDQLGLVDDDGKPYEFNLEFGTNVTGKYKKHGVWSKPLWTKVQTLQGSPPTPYIMDDFVDYKDISEAIMYWYLVGPEKRESYGAEGRRWALNEGGINSKNMCDQFIKAMDFTIDNFTPPKKFGIFRYSEEFNTDNLPQDKLGFDMHKIDVEAIKKEIQ
jgi:glycosyltransferase involved in cell wall biosynthesis